MFWKKKDTYKLIPVLPTSHRNIFIRAIEISTDPIVLINNKIIKDYSEAGMLTRRHILECHSIEVRDRVVGVVGFHDHPKEMWINENYREFACYCEGMHWLTIQGPAS
ncbi:hypothetical protein [Zooshikella ganghwensis]|uniref:hypothetical protein n=1 Tax=Zooshikella ganghwensis TaxID=202772 RepID=UPI0004895346|nr:hypothetical protein [Zooshikella ganghwensis]